MKLHWTLPSLFVFLILASFSSVRGCATVQGPAPTSEDYVDSEQAVIFWDDAHKIEHFIRQADIRTTSKDIGFLVPTPTTPELVEADAQIFQLAADEARPNLVQDIVHQTPDQIFGPIFRGPVGIMAYLPTVSLITGMSDSEEAAPKIVLEKDVAGYHAVTLAADNATSLAQWLKKNGYASTPQLAAWLKPYVDAKWKITAFKLVKPSSKPVSPIEKTKPITTTAIRMSFPTERPFFPYSEPQAKKAAQEASPYGRTLRVAVLSSQRMQGTLGDQGVWPGQLRFAGSPVSNQWLSFARLDNRLAMPTTLTYWQDDSNPRPGLADLYFSPSPDQSAFRETEIDYSLTTVHLIDLSHPLNDLAALLIVVFLPLVPLFCGVKLLCSGRIRAAEPSRSLNLSRVMGFLGVLMGSYYGISCLVFGFHTLPQIEEDLPGKPLPTFDTLGFAILAALAFVPLIYCGIHTIRQGSAFKKPRTSGTVAVRLGKDLMAFGSILIGLMFFLAVIVRLLGSFLE